MMELCEKVEIMAVKNVNIMSLNCSKCEVYQFPMDLNFFDEPKLF